MMKFALTFIIHVDLTIKPFLAHKWRVLQILFIVSFQGSKPQQNKIDNSCKQ